jgi:outer membrane receptor for ferric coprogen and ferric-rhodotorulic acid
MVETSCDGGMPRDTRRWSRALLMSAALGAFSLVVTFGPSSAIAQVQTRSFAIPAQPLSSALRAFADQSGMQLAYRTADLGGIRSPGFSGTASGGQALARLLAGTGVTYTVTGANTVTIQQPSVAIGAAMPAGAISLDTIDVQGASTSDPGMTEGTGSYTPSVTASATRLQLTPRETPQSISVITRQQIEDFNLNTVDDVMRQTPGISTVTYENERVEYYARGFAIQNFQDDGMPGHYDSGYPAGQSLSDTAMYDRVEVLKGANGLMTGSGDPGATVNLIRKKPTRTFQGHATLSGGSWDTYRGEIDLSGPLNKEGTVRGRFVATHQDRGSYMDHFTNRGSMVYGILEADLTPDTLFTVGAHYQHNLPKGTSFGGIPLFDSNGNFNDMPRSFNPGARWSSWEQYVYSVFTTLEHHFDNEWRVKVQLKRQINGYDTQLGSASNGNPNPLDGSGVSIWSGAFLGKTQLDVAEAYATGPVHLFGRKHDLVFGGSISKRHWVNSISSADPAYDPTVPNFYGWTGNIPQPPWVLDGTGNELVQNRAAYAAFRFNPHDRLKLIAGTRLVHYESAQRPYWDPANEQRIDKSVVVPYFGAIFDINEHISIYGSHTGIFQPQYEQTEQGITLPPREGTSNEVGLKSAFFNGRLNSSAAYFEIQQNNYPVETGGLAPDGNPAYRAVDGVVTKGFELEISGQLSPQWQIQAGFTHKIAKRDAIKVSTLTPENQFTLYSTYKLEGALDGLTVGGGARWQDVTWSDEVWNGVIGDDVRSTAPSYWVVDLMANYKINENLSASLNVRNLFDKKYYSIYNWYSSYTWGAPRSLQLSMTYKF